MTPVPALLAALLAATPASPPPITVTGAGALGAGGAAWEVEVGYPSLSMTYAQGVDGRNDLGAVVGASWTTGEMVLGFLWRSELAGDASSRAGFRLTAGPWFNFGGTWLHSANEPNLGLALAPGAAWTANAGPGLASVMVDLGLEWAWQRGMGVAFVPRLAAAYEAPVSRDLTVGARAGLWARWSTGSAAIPGLDDTLQAELVALLTWRVF